MQSQAAIKSDPNLQHVATHFLQQLYPEAPLYGFLSLWTLPDKKSSFYKDAQLAGERAQELASDHDVYFGIGLRREELASDKRGVVMDIISIPGFWFDLDLASENHKCKELPAALREAVEFLSSLPWLPSVVVWTGGGIHVYYLFAQPWIFRTPAEHESAVELSRRVQAYIIGKGRELGWKLDNTSDLARVLRVPGTYNRKNDQAVLVEILESHPSRRYAPADFENIVPRSVSPGNDRPRIDPETILMGVEEGQRDNALFQYASSLRARNTPIEEARILVRAAAAECRPEPFPPEEADKKVDGAYQRYNAGASPKMTDPEPPQYDCTPIEIHADAFYGLAGHIVKSTAPYTEADPKAVLFNVLVGFGNVIGNASYAVVGAEHHPTNLYAVLVGPTSSGRKGSSWPPAREVFRRIDSEWVNDRVRSGLSSGEGIIYHLRDADGKDEGVSDKRLLAIEPEFSSMLKLMAREGNTLSGIIRQGYDGSVLSSLTKNSPMKATGAHLSLIGHTTKDELLRYLDATEKANGFANRFLWIGVRRSKLLPKGEPVPNQLLDELAQKMRDAIDWAKAGRLIGRDPMAENLWAQVYEKLNEDRPGLSGAILSRAPAQILRLSVIYALMDKSPFIRVEHLKAAIAVWDASERSVLSIFGDRTGDPVADRIQDELKNRDEMTRDDIINLFSRHKTGEVDRALTMLEKIGRITREIAPTKGRPVTSYRSARKAR